MKNKKGRKKTPKSPSRKAAKTEGLENLVILADNKEELKAERESEQNCKL